MLLLYMLLHGDLANVLPLKQMPHQMALSGGTALALPRCADQDQAYLCGLVTNDQHYSENGPLASALYSRRRTRAISVLLPDHAFQS